MLIPQKGFSKQLPGDFHQGIRAGFHPTQLAARKNLITPPVHCRLDILILKLIIVE